MSEIVDAISAFILENFLFGDTSKVIDPDVSFLEAGVVDSTGILELIAFSEESYGISVSDDELLPENFDSINNLARYIQLKLRQKDNAA